MIRYTRKAARQACWTTGIRPMGYKVHVDTLNMKGVIECNVYHDALALQRAIRDALTKGIK